MKRLVLLLVCCLLFAANAIAAPLEVKEELAGTYLYPDDGSEPIFRFECAYPLFEAEHESDEAINDMCSYWYSDMMGFTAPLLAQAAADYADAASSVKISYQITHNSSEHLCLLVTQEQQSGASIYETWTAYVFDREGVTAGGVITLPELLGTLAGDEKDEKRIERASNKANELVCTLVWEIIEEQRDAGLVEYYEGLTKEDLAAEFYPESDFYLDANGQLVFFIQSGMLASESAGILTFPFSLEELQSEL